MRTLLLVLLVGSWALAQAPGTPTKVTKPEMTAKSAKALDDYLKEWETRMANVKGLETTVTLTEETKEKTMVFVGEAAFLQPGSALFFVKDKNAPENPKSIQHYLADGKYFYEFQHSKKVIRRSPLPKEGLSNILLLSFLFGMKADDIKKRFDLFTDVDDKKYFNGQLLMIMVYPKLPADQQDFVKAQFVLWASDAAADAPKRMLPVRLWLQKPDASERTTWDLSKLTIGEPKAERFKAKYPAEGWKVEDISKP